MRDKLITAFGIYALLWLAKDFGGEALAACTTGFCFGLAASTLSEIIHD